MQRAVPFQPAATMVVSVLAKRLSLLRSAVRRSEALVAVVAVVATVATMLLTPNIYIPGYVEVHSLHAIGVLDICVHDFLCLVHTRSVVPFGWNCVFI